MFTPETYEHGILQFEEMLDTIFPDDEAAPLFTRIPEFGPVPAGPVGTTHTSTWTIDYKSLLRTRHEASSQLISGPYESVSDTEHHMEMTIVMRKRGLGHWEGRIDATGTGKNVCTRGANTHRIIMYDGYEETAEPAVSHTVTSRYAAENVSSGLRVKHDEFDAPLTFHIPNVAVEELGERYVQYELTITSVTSDSTYTDSGSARFHCDHPFFPLTRMELKEGVQQLPPVEGLDLIRTVTIRKVSSPSCAGCGVDEQCRRSKCHTLLGCIEWHGRGRCDPGNECFDAYCASGECRETEEKLAFVECEEQLYDIYKRCKDFSDWQIVIEKSNAANSSVICADPDCASLNIPNDPGTITPVFGFESDRACSDGDHQDSCSISCVGVAAQPE